ncbi:hypothetical protein [Rubellicoccus peritrichatus]|uniref:Uncharacterized protein n=1 Tax=Rubellicoccus peritrichatus TaxID=3080537 RepID=A0AAQ3QWW6_9BACT|nr:hypothetical protein [Puniceicoccus sp. CR14]WOO42270.1 hypothetical protein RZN69_04155 [Puniceicoccus sp. CR14]
MAHLDEDDAKRAINRDKGIAYARAAGIAVGIFLLAWLPLNSLRWQGEGPAWLLNWESVLFALIGIFMLLPWRRFQQKSIWKPLFGILCALAAMFVFTMVIDLMFLYMHAAESNQKPPPPAFQSLMIFVIMMQPPAVLFQRRPQLLD